MLERQRLSLRNTISHLIQECKNIRQLKQVHSQIITFPYFLRNDTNFLVSRLLFVTALSESDSGSLSYGSRIFKSINNPDRRFYNIMIRAFASKMKGEPDAQFSRKTRALILYKRMLCNGIAPDCLTLPFLVKECTTMLDLGNGTCLHGQAIKFGFFNDVFVQNSMISFYSVSGFVERARMLFDEMLERDLVSWNSMVVGYLRSGKLDEALDLFRRMEKRNIITWNSIITGFVQGGRPREALEFFRDMQCLTDGCDDAVRPDKITIASVISACASLGAIDHGKWVHSFLRKSGLECDMVIGTALVDMYGKCGYLERAYEVFRGMLKKDTLAWTAMISALALNGCGKEAFDVFEEMEAAGVKPNHVTFVGLLSACAHSGLVQKGRWCFDIMKNVYLIEPQVYHYACMVDILARAGLFEEAEGLIRSMPMEPDVFVWGALLGGCQMHGNVHLGETVARYLIDLEPLNHAFYINLCDMYAKANKFDDVKRTRALMKERGLKKEVAGCSMIEVNGVIREFSATDSLAIMKEELDWTLTALSNVMNPKVNICCVNQIAMEVMQ